MITATLDVSSRVFLCLYRLLSWRPMAGALPLT